MRRPPRAQNAFEVDCLDNRQMGIEAALPLAGAKPNEFRFLNVHRPREAHARMADLTRPRAERAVGMICAIVTAAIYAAHERAIFADRDRVAQPRRDRLEIFARL